jgi:hypothetical protein
MPEGIGRGDEDRRDGPRISVRAAVIASLAVLFAAALAVVLQRAPRRSGTNIAPVAAVSVPLPGGAELCQPNEVVPADTAGVRLLARADGPAGALRARVLGSAGAISSGRLAPGWRPGWVTVPVGEVRSSRAGLTVCLRNEGAASVLLGGESPEPPYVLSIDGMQQSGRIRIEYMRPGTDSWLGLLPALTHRFSLGRATIAAWFAPLAVLALMLAVIALTVRAVLRTQDEP